MNTTPTIFITQDNDYILELSKHKSIFSPDRSICNITFKNIIGTKILSLNIPDITITNIIDNIFAYNEFGGNIICYMNATNADNSTLNSYYIGFSTEYDYDNLGIKIPNTKDIVTIYSYKDEIMIKIISFNVSDSLETLCNLLFDTFISDMDSDIKRYLFGI